MTWGEIDLRKREWLIPGERTKNGNAHLVPLSEAAIEVLCSVPRISTERGYVFTTNGKTHVSGYSRAKKALDAAILSGAPEGFIPVDLARPTPHYCKRHG